MPNLTVLAGAPTFSDAFYNLNFLESATITASTATSLTMVSGSLTFAVTGAGFTLTNIGGKDYLATGTISGIDMSFLGTPYFSMDGLAIGANLFRNTIIAEENNTNIAGLENLFRGQVYTFIGTVGGDFQSVTQLSLDGASLLTTRDNQYFLYGGADTISAGRGDDTIWADAGADSISGGNGNDVVYSGSDADTVRGEKGADYLDAGLGADWLYGGSGADTLYGGDDADRSYGGSDADVMNGGLGIDRLYGGLGDDVVAGDEGTDILFGGDGNDEMDGGLARDLLYGGAGNDTIYGREDRNRIYGGDGADSLFGDIDNDRIYGGADADQLWGNGGADLLDGSTGDDTIRGEAGIDTLNGGGGADLMYGGTEADIFVFAALSDMGIGLTHDFVLDFTSGSDKLDFAGLGLTFVTGAFTGASQVRFDALTHVVQIDTDGNLVADYEIELQAGATVVAADVLV